MGSTPNVITMADRKRPPSTPELTERVVVALERTAAIVAHGPAETLDAVAELAAALAELMYALADRGVDRE